ncbi:MAG: hypothetical protein Q7T80_07220, partial [Methanoregula sp.]|nr:hypothetical protein [Methanoregula sp.]
MDCSTVGFRFHRIRAFFCFIRYDHAVTIGIFKNYRYRQFPALHAGDLLQQQAGILSLFRIPVDYCRSYCLDDAVQHPFDIGY